MFRVLSAKGLADFEALAATSLFERHRSQGTLVATDAVDAATAPEIAGVPLVHGTAGLVRHERIPVITYPYEWTFGMLKAAALLQLQVTREALGEGLMVKDATPYNVQWRGAAPVIVDIGSFERLREGEPWPGYRQFCMLYLYPLMLQARRGVDFQGFLRASLDGITPPEMNALRRARDVFRKGVLTDVVLHARLEKRYGSAEREEVSKTARKISPEMIQRNVARLEKVVRGLTWNAAESEWSGYRAHSQYEAADHERKATFVRESVTAAQPRLVWDLGANDGAYSRIAAGVAETVLALDIDHLTVERLYASLAADGPANVLPLVFDLVDPSPGLGWRGRERRPIEDRARPDHLLALAVVHHICIGRNIPVAELFDLLGALGAGGVIEFVDRDDPMAKRLLSRKGGEPNPDYTAENFESQLRKHFEVVREERLPSGTRVLYDVRPRA